MRRGFTLIEMLVVIGIITVLIGVSIASFSKMTKSAEGAKVLELVKNTETALTVYFQRNGAWPQRILSAGKDGKLDEKIALVLAKANCMSLATDNQSNPEYATKLIGVDRCGVVTPWATTVLKRAGESGSLGTIVSGTKTVDDHILHFAVDLDGDGVVEASVGGESVRIRATAAVWCGGKDGVIETYTRGRRKDDVYSWTYGQTQNVN